MITQMSMKNFKSWASTGDIRLAPLTGFFGTNSSGKSSLLQMLLLLKQTAESRDRKLVLRTGGDKDSYIDLGTIPDLIYGDERTVTFELSWDFWPPLANFPSDNINGYVIEDLTFNTVIFSDGTQNYVQTLNYSSDSFIEASMSRRNDGEYDVTASIDGKKLDKREGHFTPDVSAPIKCYGFSDGALYYYQDSGFMSDFVLAFERLFQKVYYLGPLRDYPQRFYNWAGEEPYDVGMKGELAVAALLARNAQSLQLGQGKRSDLEINVSKWLKKMGMAYSFRTINVGSTQYQALFTRNKEGLEVAITDMGFGISQVLPVLVLCYYCPEGSTIILEQPEIHLHPSVQSVLADVFIEVTQERKVQIIFESHSEHLLRRLQLRIAEEKQKNQDTALYFCDIERGVSKIAALNVDLFGNITNWPKDFFGDLTGDMVETAQAGIKRRFKAS